MSQENVKLTYRVADAVNRRDLDGFLALMATDVRSHPQLACGDAYRATMESVARGRPVRRGT